MSPTFMLRSPIAELLKQRKKPCLPLSYWSSIRSPTFKTLMFIYAFIHELEHSGNANDLVSKKGWEIFNSRSQRKFRQFLPDDIVPTKHALVAAKKTSLVKTKGFELVCIVPESPKFTRWTLEAGKVYCFHSTSPTELRACKCGCCCWVLTDSWHLLLVFTPPRSSYLKISSSHKCGWSVSAPMISLMHLANNGLVI